MEIIIIIVIIVVIMMLMGGLGPTGLVAETQYAALAESQFHCDRVVWTDAPRVENGRFDGRLEIACEVQGIGMGGIPVLEQYLNDRVVKKAAKFYGSAQSVREGTMDGVAYDVAVRGEAEGESMELRGTTRLVSDGAIELRHTFVADPKEAQKANRYLRGAESELYVTSTLRPNWYRVVVSHRASIAKPALVSASRFRSMIVEKLETKTTEESKAVLTSVANNL